MEKKVDLNNSQEQTAGRNIIKQSEKIITHKVKYCLICSVIGTAGKNK